MPEVVWSDQVPEDGGFYWARRKHDGHTEIVCIDQEFGDLHSSDGLSVSTGKFRWQYGHRVPSAEDLSRQAAELVELRAELKECRQLLRDWSQQSDFRFEPHEIEVRVIKQVAQLETKASG